MLNNADLINYYSTFYTIIPILFPLNRNKKEKIVYLCQNLK